GGLLRAAHTQPVDASAELTADEHQDRQWGWRNGSEPGRWQVNQLTTVLEPRRLRACRHRHDPALVRHDAIAGHRLHGRQIGLVGRRPTGYEIPGGVDRPDVSDP